MPNIQQIAEENERRIVRFNNIDKEDFTHSFRGISITVNKGESYVGRFPECDHLALHLARKILARDKKEKGADKDPKGSVLWTPEEIAELKGKILQDLGSETQKKVTPEDARKRDQEDLNKKYTPKAPEKEVTKADIIKDLKARGIEPDVNKNKEELLKQLMETESKSE